MPSGIEAPNAQGHEGFCGWDAITSAVIIEGGEERFVEVSGRYLAVPLRLTMPLAANPELARLVERYAGPEHPLTQVLWEAGA